jgi:hypothetical protein
VVAWCWSQVVLDGLRPNVTYTVQLIGSKDVTLLGRNRSQQVVQALRVLSPNKNATATATTRRFPWRVRPSQRLGGDYYLRAVTPGFEVVYSPSFAVLATPVTRRLGPRVTVHR